MTQFSLKVHDGEKGRIVAACDTDLLGKRFHDDATVLEVAESFYGGDRADLAAVISATERCVTTNFIGEKLITALIAEGIVDEAEVRYVDGVPHTQLFFL